MYRLSPLIVFLASYLGLCVIGNDFSHSSITLIAFLIASIYAISITKGPIDQRITRFSTGAGSPTVLLMVWIYVMAGAFAYCAKQMGCIEATVDVTLHLLPPSLLLPGIFLAACFVSLAVGTSVGTIIQLTPIAVGIALKTDVPLSLMVAIVVGGAYFGDNLSFISDTTIAATQTQGCAMHDKFRANLRIVLPVALIMLVIYYILGRDTMVLQEPRQLDLLLVVPYLAVIIVSLIGVNVMMVLFIGIILTCAIGLWRGAFGDSGIFGMCDTLGTGMIGMGEMILMAMLAAGLLELIRHNGGIDWLLHHLTRGITSRRSAEFSIASLVCLVNICTANNTVAILTAGPIARTIAERYNIPAQRAASILDTISCFTQGLLPYGVQLLFAANLVTQLTDQPFSPASIIPFLFYPMGIGLATLLTSYFARR
ncbi:MAG: Na+/H+ antiporter NhaC family protein [Bacteroidales bacterium]|nr:Na+/H+ antiporter NhaC family protein [Candidatus Liminaster caballi]